MVMSAEYKGQILQSFIGNGDVSIWVKTSRVGIKTPYQKTNKEADRHIGILKYTFLKISVYKNTYIYFFFHQCWRRGRPPTSSLLRFSQTATCMEHQTRYFYRKFTLELFLLTRLWLIPYDYEKNVYIYVSNALYGHVHIKYNWY